MPPSTTSSTMNSSPRPESRTRNSTQDQIDRNREGASRYSANSAGSGSNSDSRSDKYSNNMFNRSTPTPEPVIPVTYYAPGYGPNGPVTPAVTPEGTVAPVTPATVAPVAGAAPMLVDPVTGISVPGSASITPSQQKGVDLLPRSVKLSGEPIVLQGGYQAINSGLIGNMLDPYRKTF